MTSSWLGGRRCIMAFLLDSCGSTCGWSGGWGSQGSADTAVRQGSSCGGPITRLRHDGGIVILVIDFGRIGDIGFCLHHTRRVYSSQNLLKEDYQARRHVSVCFAVDGIDGRLAVVIIAVVSGGRAQRP